MKSRTKYNAITVLFLVLIATPFFIAAACGGPAHSQARTDSTTPHIAETTTTIIKPQVKVIESGEDNNTGISVLHYTVDNKWDCWEIGTDHKECKDINPSG